jgi:hypothetical protein
MVRENIDSVSNNNSIILVDHKQKNFTKILGIRKSKKKKWCWVNKHKGELEISL